MMRFFVAVMLLCNLSAFAQKDFEPGYIIDQQGNRTECMLRNKDWLRSPKAIRYKLSDTGEIQTADVRSLREFGVSSARYVCREVRMDTSTQVTSDLSAVRAPAWGTRYVALKTLVDGKASLFQYTDKNFVLYFYSVDGSEIRQLEYKLYKYYDDKDKNIKMATNLRYLNQLRDSVSCGAEFSRIPSQRLKYEAGILTDYFARYNQCSGATTVNYHEEAGKGREKFRLRIAPGIDFSSATITTGTETKGNDISFRIGLEGEIVLPVYHDRWSVIIEPTYQSVVTDGQRPLTYSSIELPVGLRYNFYLNDQSRLYLNAAGLIDFPIENKVQLSSVSTVEDIGGSWSVTAGAGFVYRRFSLEGRYYFNRKGFQEFELVDTKFCKMSVILGFRIL